MYIPGFLLGIVITGVVGKSTPVDLTTVVRATGQDVVQAVVQRISGSGIFSSDNGILRRIAYVESKDGTNVYTFRDGYYGGIWQVNQSRFLDTKNTASYPALLNQYTAISKAFDITWSLVTWKDLEKPLYSGLAAQLLLSAATIPFSIQDQAAYWKKMYTSGNGTAEQFIQDVLNLEDTNKKCASSVSVDIVLVLDKSGSIGTNNFDLVRSLCINITKGFQIEDTGTRIGIIGFSSSASIEFNLGQYNTTAAIINAINNIVYTALGTQTDVALQLLPTAFREANGARPLSSGIPKVAVVITDGQSNSPALTKSAASALHSDSNSSFINVYAVGVGSGIDYNELQTIASKASNVKDLSSFSVDQFRDLQSSIIRDSCTSSAVITTNGSVNSSVSTNPKYFYVTVDASGGSITLFLKVSSGAVRLYASFQISTPNAAFYTWIISTDSASNTLISSSSMTNSTILYLGVQGYATNNAFVLSTASGNVSTPQPPSGPPQNLTVLINTSRTVYVKWDPPLEFHQNGIIDKYLLRVFDEAAGETRNIYLSELQYTIGGLYPDRTYSISVQAHNSDGFGPSSNSAIGITAEIASAGTAISGILVGVGGLLLLIVVIFMM